MKKIKYYVFLLGLMMVIMASSCKKFLEEKTNASMVVPRTLEDLQRILDNAQSMNAGLSSMSEAASDNYMLTETQFNSLQEVYRRNYIWDNDEYYYNNDWAKGYTVVYNSNLVIDLLKKIGRTADNAQQYDQVLGSALFFRASQYLNLLWTYAKAYNESTADTDLGIVLRESADFNKKSVRSSVKQCYERVEADLLQAAELLPNKTIHVNRPAKSSVYGMLARYFLSKRSYVMVGQYSRLYLENRSELIDFNDDKQVNQNATYPFEKFNKEIDFYQELSVNYLAVSRAFVDPTVYNSYAGNDLRKVLYFKNNGAGIINFKGNYNPAEGLFAGIATDEVMLMQAESLVRSGQVKDGIALLNKLLSTRYKSGSFQPYEVSDPKSALELVLNERRKELLFRGLRWMDIKRLNLEERNISIVRSVAGQVYTLKPNENRFALPLPYDVILETGMPQNPK
ncbi:RagB/SusD family nutrient uptake outer membrane protein [uncultured Sphingobacterium sp.]|uniref:RagB/SusD family nutrient uptake outer membrane protein n=1 Tax=uncultured Sphingobacterium sp. TaxID=182688 RepID=UPI0025F9FE07|nr:RagB/SusD family nutrient uptake outer membrane protein [uncultured Sphingobacterium sp.]